MTIGHVSVYSVNFVCSRKFNISPMRTRFKESSVWNLIMLQVLILVKTSILMWKSFAISLRHTLVIESVDSWCLNLSPYFPFPFYSRPCVKEPRWSLKVCLYYEFTSKKIFLNLHVEFLRCIRLGVPVEIKLLPIIHYLHQRSGVRKCVLKIRIS